MGHSLSASKRERQNLVRREHNRANRSVLKKELKKFDKAVREKPAESDKAFAEIQSALDTAVRKNAIPKGRADRKKARLALLIQRLKSGAAPQPAPAKASA